MRARRPAAAALAVALLAGCAAPPRPRPSYEKVLAANPRSVLVVPVLNESVEVNAADCFLATIPVPVAERGYYVFPVNLVKRVLEDDGLADAGLVHAADPVRLAALFGADAVLYVTIKRWDARYVVLATTVTVQFSYVLRDGHTGEVLWRELRTAVHQSDSGGNNGAAGLLVALVSAAITKAAPSYMPLAQAANQQAMGAAGAGFPYGPLRPEYGSDYPRGARARPAQGAATPAPAPAPAAEPGPAPEAIASPPTPESAPAPATAPAGPAP